MNGRSIKPGTVINGKTVARSLGNGVAQFRVVKSVYSAPARLVIFTDGSRGAFELDRPVPGTVSGYAEPLPAGGVKSGHVQGPPKVRAHDGRWRGEQVKGMRTRDHDLIAKTNMFDTGRVNGRVGTTPGAGAVALTGPSFPAGA